MLLSTKLMVLDHQIGKTAPLKQKYEGSSNRCMGACYKDMPTLDNPGKTDEVEPNN